MFHKTDIMNYRVTHSFQHTHFHTNPNLMYIVAQNKGEKIKGTLTYEN